ncbi:MAG TPA: EamA family transporter [Chthoniobacterales bacterium]
MSRNWFVWALLSAVFAGATAILAKVGVKDVDSNLATAIRTTVILFFTWALFLLTNPVRSLGSLNSRTWMFLTLSGIATGLSWVCYFRALQLGPASRVAPVDKLSVMFAIVFALIFLHERLGWLQWVGGGLILIGTVLLALEG